MKDAVRYSQVWVRHGLLGKTVTLFGLFGYHENRQMRFSGPQATEVVVERGSIQISLVDRYQEKGEYPQLPIDQITRLSVAVPSPVVTREHVRDWCFDVGQGSKFKSERLHKGTIRIDMSEIMNLIVDLVPGPL